MLDHSTLLNILGIQTYIPREAQPSSSSQALYFFSVLTTESSPEFTEAHQIQLKKIMDYLAYPEKDYVLLHQDSNLSFKAQTVLQFGPIENACFEVKDKVETLSLSQMLTDPACKRQVLHDIARLRS